MGAARHASGASLSTSTGLPDATWKVHCVEKLDGEADAAHQGLTLVHFSAQLEPCLTHINTLHTLNAP